MKREYEAPKVITFAEDEITRNAWSSTNLLTKPVSNVSINRLVRTFLRLHLCG